MNLHYQLGLLCLTHLLINADGMVDDAESNAIRLIQEREKINKALLAEFEHIVLTKTERDIFELGIEQLNQCSDAEKLRAFTTLYKLSEVDGRVHVKEIRLLLYSIKLADVEFSDVVNHAIASPSLM